MKRVCFNNGKQVEFLEEVIGRINRPLSGIANICRVDKRTLYDWRRGRYQITYSALRRLVKLSKVYIPKNIDILPEYWYVKKGARRGAISRNKLYGNPGTPEGRRKGGLVTIKKFKAHPSYAKKLGFKLRKEIKYPKRSASLAELIGIILGDGSINKNQIKITLNSKTDREYANYIMMLIKKLFATRPSLRTGWKNTVEILIYSRNIVDFLLRCGLKAGNKIRNQIDIPKWIFSKNGFIKGCLTGLIDTDGGIYFHNHTTKGIKYRNIGLCFTNRSLPLLNSTYCMLLKLGIFAKSDRKERIYIYGLEGIKKYMLLVGSNNVKHINRFKGYRGSKV